MGANFGVKKKYDDEDEKKLFKMKDVAAVARAHTQKKRVLCECTKIM